MTFTIAGRQYFAHELSALELSRFAGLRPDRETQEAITREWIERSKVDRRSEVHPESVERRVSND